MTHMNKIILKRFGVGKPKTTEYRMETKLDEEELMGFGIATLASILTVSGVYIGLIYSWLLGIPLMIFFPLLNLYSAWKNRKIYLYE